MFGLSSSEQPRDGALIEGVGLTLSRGSRSLLRGVDVSLSEGEILTLVGPNGAGKTTLLRALIGLERCDRGQLRRRAGLRVGYVPQSFAVDRNLPLTVGRFLRLAGGWRGGDWRTAVTEVGVERLLEQSVQELSGGELRRVLLARALSRRPQVLALDEPAAGLDHTSQAELYGLIQRLRDRYRLGVLIISHDLRLVMAASDRVVCLGQGKVCCRGAPTSVQEHPEYLALFGELGPATAVYPHTHPHTHSQAPQASSSVARSGSHVRNG